MAVEVRTAEKNVFVFYLKNHSAERDNEEMNIKYVINIYQSVYLKFTVWSELGLSAYLLTFTLTSHHCNLLFVYTDYGRFAFGHDFLQSYGTCECSRCL